MKTKKPIFLVLLFGVTMLSQPSARAEIGFGDILGVAWTIGNAINGGVTLTPAYAVQTWYYRLKGTKQGPAKDLVLEPDSFSNTKKVKRDRLGTYFYYSKSESSSSPTVESQDAFPVDHLNKINKVCTCDVFGDGSAITTTTTVETQTELVWMAKVDPIGLWPDDGPWTVWLITEGQKMGSCPCTIPSRAPVDAPFCVSASIGKSGSQTVSLGYPNCTLNYPFYLGDQFYR
jgi:hypothetical protein